MASKRNKRRRSCEQKVGHDTMEAAERERIRLYRKRWTYRKLNIYKCKFCGKYHVGRRPRK